MRNKLRKIAWIILIAEDILLFPCAILSVYRLIEFCGVDFNYAIWTRMFLGFILPMVFLQCFYIPYILIVIICALFGLSNLYGKHEHIKISNKEKWLLLLASIMCVLGMLSVGTAFDAAMSV